MEYAYIIYLVAKFEYLSFESPNYVLHIRDKEIILYYSIIYIYIYIYIYIRIYMYPHKHTHTHTYIYIYTGAKLYVKLITLATTYIILSYY